LFKFIKEMIYWMVIRLKQSLKQSFATVGERGICKFIEHSGTVLKREFYNPSQIQELTEKGTKFLAESANEVWESEGGADQRVFGIDRKSEAFSRYFHDKYLQNVFKNYLTSATTIGYAMFARITYQVGNKGSGEGWHRDSIQKQIKSILYLSDVSSENGPFQYIKFSHKPYVMLLDWLRYGITPLDHRITDEKVNRIIKNEPSRLVEFDGKAGDLIIADTSGIHRGKPLDSGSRIAVTNYVWEKDIPAHMDKVALKPLITNR
jgi:hypothetical protein